MQRKVELKARIDGLQFLVAAAPLNLPIAIPERPRDSFTAAMPGRNDWCVRRDKTAAIEIAQREMAK